MKTTLELPEALFRKAKATAARHGQTLKQLVQEALAEKLARMNGAKSAQNRGWRSPADLSICTPRTSGSTA